MPTTPPPAGARASSDPASNDTRPIALLLGLLPAFVVILVGALVFAIPAFWIDGITIATATVGFFTALCVRVRHSPWWWVGIACGALTFAMLIAQQLPWLPRAVWG